MTNINIYFTTGHSRGYTDDQCNRAYLYTANGKLIAYHGQHRRFSDQEIAMFIEDKTLTDRVREFFNVKKGVTDFSDEEDK